MSLRYLQSPLVALLCLAACGSATPEASPNPRPLVLDRATTPTTYETVAGVWNGRGFQVDIREHWDLRMHVLGEAEQGAPIGDIDYPGLRCKSTLTRLPEREGHLVVLETLTEGQETCVDGGTIRMRLDGSGRSLEWHYYFPNGEFGAEAVLARE